MGKGPIILLFVKAPVGAAVKSRLAATIGDEAAQCLYREFVLDILDTIKSSRHPFRICFSPPEAGGMVADWLGPLYQYEPQNGNDLGARMEHAFRKAFSDDHDVVVLIGSDIPDLPAYVLDEAIDAAQARDVVIGPAADGGYYLIGLTRSSLTSALFRGIMWSSAAVFQQTMNAALRAGLTVHQLPVWRDVDVVADLRDLFDRNRNTAFSRSRTMAALKNFFAGHGTESGEAC